MDKPHGLGKLTEPPCCRLGAWLALRKFQLSLDIVQGLCTHATQRVMGRYTVHAADGFLDSLGVQEYVRTQLQPMVDACRPLEVTPSGLDVAPIVTFLSHNSVITMLSNQLCTGESCQRRKHSNQSCTFVKIHAATVSVSGSPDPPHEYWPMPSPESPNFVAVAMFSPSTPAIADSQELNH